MGCISLKNNTNKLDRQSAYIYTLNPNNNAQQAVTKQRVQIDDQSKQKLQMINQNNIFINKERSSHLKKAIQILNINNDNHFKQKVEALKLYYKSITQFQRSHQKDFDEIMLHIQSKTITLQILLNKNDQLQMPQLDILFVINNEGKSLIELILNHIDNYDIITQLLLEQNLSESHLQTIAIPLFRKLKYLHSNINVERAIQFLKATSKTKFIEVILIASQQKGNNNIIQNFNNIFTYIDQSKELHLKFFKILCQMIKGVKPFEKKYEEYLEASTAYKLKNFRISKKIKKGHMQDELKMHLTLEVLQLNIFHLISLDKKWDIFVQYSNSLIQSPNNSQLTPFMILFQNAPFKIILKYIQQFPQQFIRGIDYSTSQGLNLLHCFCLNKDLSTKIDKNCQEIMNLLIKNNNFKKLLLQPYQDQIPLVFYLNRYKVIDQQFLDFLGQNLKKDFDFYKLDTLAQILGEKLKFRKIKQKRSIKDLKRMKKQAFKYSQYELNIELSQELQQQYDLYYLHYIQLMKVVIKRKFSIKYSHLTQFFTFTSYFPYDLGTTHHSFLQIVLQNQDEDFILQQLKIFNFINYLQAQKKELDKFNIQLPIDYSLDAQLLAKLIYLKQDIKDQSSQLHKEINQIILNQLRRDPKLLWSKIYGNSKLKYEGFNTTLYQLIKQLLDVVFVKDVLEISIYNNFQNPSIDIMKEFVFQELLYRKVTKKELDLRNFCDSFPRSIEFNETIKQIDVKVNKDIKNYQVKLYTWNLGLYKSQNKLEIAEFYLFIQHFKQKSIQNLIQQSTNKSEQEQQQKITVYFLQALLESEVTLYLINRIINLNPKYFIPKIWWLTQNCSPNKQLLQLISTKHINPIIITQTNINQLDLFFDWQMSGVLFKIIRFPKQKYIFHDLLIKSQLICFQQINKLPFVIALAIDDYFNVELSKFLQNSEIQKTKELISQIQLHMMLQNQATKNIQLLIDYFNLDAYSLIYILGLNHFSNSKLFEYTPSEIQEVNKFNFNHQIQQLLKYNFKYSDQICPIFIFKNQNNETFQESYNKIPSYFIPLIDYINYESLSMFDIKLRNQLYERLNFEISYDKINDDRLMEIFIEDIVKLKRQEYGIERMARIFTNTFIQAINNNKNIAEILCRHLSKEELEYSKYITINLLQELSLISNQICIQYLNKLKLQNYQFLQVYYYALNNQNIELLNHLINYYYENRMSSVYVYNYKYLNKNVKNYHKAIYQKYYLIFNVNQYQLLYNTVKLKSQTISEHIQMFILFGYVDQLKFLIQQPNIQVEIQNFYFHYVFAKKMCIENVLGFGINNFPKHLANKQIQLQLFFLNNFKRTYQQFCKFSLYKENCSFNFYEQNIDYVETFEILNNIMSNSKEKTEELDGFNELYSLIIHPQKKQIKLKNELISYFCKLFIRTKTLNKYIADNYDKYISLFNANSKNIEIIFDFRKPKQFSLKFILEILIEYIQQIKNINNLQVYERLTDYIFKYQFKSLKLVECLKLGLQNYNLTKFNQTTLYYTQSQVNILPKTYYDYSKNKHFYNRYKLIQSIMNIDEISLDKMTPIQVLLSKGQIDHIQQISYSNSNLMAALISNNFSTIQGVLDLSKNSKKICSDFKLFHIILKFQNEKNIISFFDKYIENSIKDIDQLMFLQDESILLSIVCKRQYKVFDRIIVQYLQKLTNSKNHLQIVQQHLQMKVKESDLMIYQLGILQKSYFIFDFLDGIIQAEEIKQLIKKLDINLGSMLSNYQLGDRKINLFAKYYINSLQILLIPTSKQKLKKIKIDLQNNKKDKKIKDISVWKKDNNNRQRITQLDNLLDIEHACIYKLFGFNQFIIQYLKNNFKFFSLFQSKAQDILIAIDFTKGHPKLLEFYLNSLPLENIKDNLDEIVKKCQQFYLIQNPIFYKVMLTFPEKFISLLKPADFNLEISLLLSCKLKQTQTLKNFILNQQQIQPKESQNLNGIDIIQNNYLFMMSLFLNNFQLPILKTEIQNINIEILIKSLKFIEENFEKQQTNISNEGLQFIFNLLNKEIVISNKNKFQQLINSQYTGQPIILGMIWIQQIKEVVKLFFSKLPKWGIFVNKVMISFDNVPISFNNDNYILPLQYKNDRFELDEIYINDFMSGLKQLKYERVMETESNRFLKFQEKWPQYNFNLLFKKINVNLIPSYCFENLVELDLEIQNKTQKRVIQKKNYKGIKQKDSNSKENENNQEQFGLYESMIFFKNLLDPLKENSENYHINDLQAPHKNQDEDQKLINESKGVRQKETGSNTFAKKLLKQKIEIIKTILPNNKYKSRFTNEQITVFMEFYHFIYPQTTDLFLQPLSSQEYIQQYNPKATLEFLIYKLKQYYHNLQELIKSEKYEKWTINIPYYIENDQFIYQEIQFTPYAIQFIFLKLLNFIQTVRSFSDFEIDIIQWRINTISLLQVLVKAILDYYFLDNKSVDIFAIIDSICQWNFLQMLLAQIIYRNLMSLPKIANLFSRIYVEFQENPTTQQQTKSHSTFFLDQIFQFEQTEYRIYNKTLIITLNVFIRHEKNLWNTTQFNKQFYRSQFNKSSIFQAIEMSFHLYNVINESDFFFDVFSPEDLVAYFFNRQEIDSYIQKFSDQLSLFVNKDVSLIVNHTQLKKLYEDQIIEIKGITDREVKVQRQNQIQNELLRLKDFFLAKVIHQLFEQLMSESFEQLFLVQLSILLQSIRLNNQLLQSTQQNFRRTIKSTKSKVVETIAKFSTHKLLSFQFGFQITPTYFQQIVKVGDICMVLYQEDGSLKLEPCQFIQNQDSSLLYFYKLQDQNTLLDLDEIDGKLRASVQEKEILNLVFEDIITIIWFRSTWPIEQNFNDEILNLIFLDQNGNMLACHEKKFLQKINMIQKFENEQQKQLLLDNLFGQNLVSIYDKFALTQIIPIIPSQINYNFKFENQQQQNVIKNNNDIDITISNNNFILDKLSIGNFNTACYFDSNQGIQKFVKKLNKFTQRIKEMSKILMKIYFDDDLNKHPSFYLEQFFAHNNIFEEFELGFKEFCEEKQFPKIENSLSYLFDVPSLTYVKERIFCQIVKQIEFHFKLNQTHEFIQFQNGILRIYMFINGHKPIQQDISCFIQNLIVKYEQFEISHLIIKDQLYNIEIQNNQQFQLSNSLANTILLTKYLYQLIQLKQNQKKEKKITFLLQFNQYEQCFYKFHRQNRQIILQYNLLKDFCLDVFLLDYLNYCNHQGQIKYENLILDNTLFNCQILQNLINVKDSQYYPQLKKEEKNLYISKDFSYLQILEGRLDPKEQERGLLIFQCKGVYQAIITFKSQQKYIPLYQYFKQHTNRQFFGQSFYFLVSGLNQQIDLDSQLNTIQVKIIDNNKKIKRSLNYYKRYNSKLNINTRLITTNIALVELIVQGIKTIKIRSTASSLLMSSINNENYSNTITIQFDPDKTIQQSQNKLAHIGVLIEDQKNDQIYKTISFRQKQSKSLQTENRKIVQFLLKGIDYKPQIFQKTNSSNSKFDLKDLQNDNVITTLNQNQINIASFCGQIRTDFMEFLDLTGSQIACENAVFVHSQYQQIYVQPKVFKETLGLKFQWQPIIKGIYNLYLGDQKIDGHFIVLANNVDYRRCEIILSEKINTLTLYQTIKFVIKLRDHFNNIYGDIEYKLNKIQTIVVTKSEFSDQIVEQIGPNKEGIITLNIKFTQKEDIEHQPEDVQINITLLDKLESSYTFHLEGLNLEMRIIKYYQKLKIPKVFRELSIDRNKFGTNIFKEATKNFKCPLKIKFIGEEGSDDGGLRREFYYKVGEMMKSPQNGFFQQNKKSQTYFYSPKFNLEKEKDVYALVFGKLIANSLLNKEIIGVPFAHQFWKLIFNQSITFEDLDGIMDENEFQNYKSLKQMTQEELEMLEVNFTIIKAKEIIQLIPDGDKTFVSIYNKDIYLQRIAEYYIIERFQQITKKINEGFEQVLNKGLLIECFDFTEMHTLTVGSDEIQPDKVLELVKYQNGSDQLIQFFQKFINQLETEQLQDFLQFTTGSPYLPWNAKPTIQIEFQESMKETNLPRSQTCFYKLTIPYYKTYEELKKKMEIAIEYGQEGFGQF